MHQLLSVYRSVLSPFVWPSVRSRTLGVMICVCAALIGTEALQLWRVYDDNIRQNDLITSNTAQSLASQAETSLQTADTIVASLVEQVEAEGTGPEAKSRLYHLMTSLAAALPAIHEMGIMDKNGDPVVKSLVTNLAGLNYSEREYYRYHRAHADRQAYIGERITSKIDGAQSITVTRRYNNPDGSFGGVVVASVSLSFFQHLFDQMQAKSGGVIVLLGDDGVILVRSPALPKASYRIAGELRQDLQDHPGGGSVAYKSGFDAVQRQGSYQHLRGFPLTALVSQSDWDIQAPWRAELEWHGIILTCVIIVVIGLGGRAITATNLLAAQAMQDSLTGLANRRCFDERIQRELKRAARSGQPVSVIMIDIDHFKAFNDCYGHPAGDECLRLVARTIQGSLRRQGEFAARYGGEEIAVLLPGCDGPRAAALAETMLRAVRGLALRQAGHLDDVVTFSAGVGTCAPGRDEGDAQALVEMADTALYAAKAAGRNRVATAWCSGVARGREAAELVSLPSAA
nr:sensor domain-containing diguanylate cyclase [uncultured Rhodopila sp.]